MPLDHTTAPNEWKQEIIDNIDVQNIAAGGDAITADIGLFYNQLYQRVRAGVIDQGMKGVPVHIPGNTVWTNIDVNGQRVEHLIAPPTTSGDSAAFEMPGF